MRDNLKIEPTLLPFGLSNLGFISIIIPVYNNPKGLDLCLNYIKKQSMPPKFFEIVIVDNLSSPPINIHKQYPFSYSIVLCEKPGSYAARNMGVRRAKGNIIAFLDADCVPEENWLEDGVHSLLNSSLACIIGGEVSLTLSEEPTAVEFYQYVSGFGQKVNIEKNKFSATANLFVRKKHFKQIGYFEESLLSCGDREWSWRAKNLGVQLLYCPSTVVYTTPRKSLKAAAKQARRVTGGRYHLQKRENSKMKHSPLWLEPRRSVFKSFMWLLALDDLPLLIRTKIACVAIVLKTVSVLEEIRLRLGGTPERC